MAASGGSVLVVDDDPMLLDRLESVLRKESFTVFTASSGEEALGLLEGRSVDVIISDEEMPGMSGSELLAVIREKYPETMRVILTGHATIQAAIRSINEGEVFRFLEKPFRPVELTAVINDALLARVETSSAAQLLRVAREQVEILDQVRGGEPKGKPRLNEEVLKLLSVREREVAQQFAAGKKVPQIAEDLFISQHTVRNHIKSIYTKLDVHSQVELVNKIRGD